MPAFKLPDVGEGLTEAEMVSWKVKEGDVVAINDIICEIETAKSIVELPSPFAGTVQKLMVAEGETVPVGTPIIAIGDGSEAVGESTPVEPVETNAEMEIDLSNPAASGGGEGESLVGRNKADRGPVRRARKGSASPSSEAGANAQLQVQGAFSQGGAQSAPVHESDEPAVPATPARPHDQPLEPAEARALAKPPVRKLAKDLGVDLAGLTGSGAGGVITRADVESASSVGRAASASERRRDLRTRRSASARPASRSRASAR